MPGGRPTVMTPELIGKLEQAFMMGCTDREASVYGGINPSTLYDYCNANPEFSERKEALKSNPVLRAKMIQMEDLEKGDSAIAQKVIDRKEGKKLEVSGPEGAPLALNFTGVGSGPPTS